MKKLKEIVLNEAKQCKYCNAEKAKKGIPFGIADDAQLCIMYDNWEEDDKYHFYIDSETNHIDAYALINYCPFCGRKLE